MSEGQPFATRIRVIWIIHFALVGALAIYLLLLFVLDLEQFNTGRFNPMLSLVVLAAMSMGSIMLALVWPRVSPLMQPGRDDPPARYLDKLQMRVIVTDSFYESIGIYGLVAVLVGAPLWQGVAAIGLSAICLAAHTGAIVGWIEDFRRRVRR